MTWEFDPDVACATIVDLITDYVGDDLGTMITPQGVSTTTPAVFSTNQDIPEPNLPFISVDFLSSSDRFGAELYGGVLESEDPDTGETGYYVYKDIYLEYIVRIRCEGDGGHKILRQLRNMLLFDDARSTMEESCESAIQYIAPVRRVSAFLDTNYREINTTDLTFNTVDRYIDYSSEVVDGIEINSSLATSDEDTDAITSDQSVDTTGD